jgi:transcriptional regulator with XRE-family HTH domain
MVIIMRLKDLREDHDYTQSRVAEYLHCKQNTYQQYESQKRQIPIEALKKLAVFYCTSVDYILELTDEPNYYPRRETI